MGVFWGKKKDKTGGMHRHQPAARERSTNMANKGSRDYSRTEKGG